jgi:DNA-directed RNA polymerase specialized sigma24 family protein
VPSVGRPKQDADREVSADSFAKLLAWLDPDPERAGEKYTDIHKRLMRLFDYRGCEHPDELADETMAAVTRRVTEVAEGYEGDPIAYFYGVARNLIRRDFASRERVRAHLRDAVVYDPPPAELERRHDCLDQCLEAVLSAAERDLILEYYRAPAGSHIAQREGLARGADVSAMTLRKRTQRLRRRLQECLIRCLEQNG